MQIKDFPWNLPKETTQFELKEFKMHIEDLFLDKSILTIEYSPQWEWVWIQYGTNFLSAPAYKISTSDIGTRRELYEKIIIGLGFIAGIVEERQVQDDIQ